MRIRNRNPQSAMAFTKDNQLVVLGETNFRNQRWRFGINRMIAGAICM